jgi:hypothetical protein
VADWRPQLGRCHAEAPAGEDPGAVPRRGGVGRGRQERESMCAYLFAERESMCAYAWASMHPGYPSIRLVGCGAMVLVRACLLVRAHVCHVLTPYLSPISHQLIISIPSPQLLSPLTTAMVSQAMVHLFPRPPSLRVVSCPVSRLASVPSRCAATSICPSIQPGQRLLTVVKGRYLHRG